MAHADFPPTSRAGHRISGFWLVAVALSLGSGATKVSLCDWAGRFGLSVALTCSRVSLETPAIRGSQRRTGDAQLVVS
jgi:hypothetical protein